MSVPFRPLPLVLALAAVPLVGQAEPKVLFCQGECFAVTDTGERRPAPKGTALRPGERFETGPNTYAQVRVGPDADVGLGESGRLRIDQTTFKDRDVLILDQGRMRAVSGEAVGKPAAKPIELRTTDGIFAIRNADVEAKKLDNVAGAPGLTYVKPNAGNVALITGSSQTALGNQAVQGVSTGKVVTGQSFNVGEVALPARAVPAGSGGPATAGPRAAVNVPVANLPALPPPVASGPANAALLPAGAVPATRVLDRLDLARPGNSPVDTARNQIAVAPKAFETATTHAVKGNDSAGSPLPAGGSAGIAAAGNAPNAVARNVVANPSIAAPVSTAASGAKGAAVQTQRFDNLKADLGSGNTSLLRGLSVR